MQTTACPNCGAPVTFRSHASVMAVCEFCRTGVLKDADSVKNLGKISDVLEDYSPLQIGVSGIVGGPNGQGFTVVGRIQLRYDGGIWNEWYLLFSDGKAGWLGDSSGLYTLTKPHNPKPGTFLPSFSALKIGHNYTIDGVNFILAERREAQCIGGQGELPFQVGEGYSAKVADFRRGKQFLTLDYSDSEHAQVFSGNAVTLQQLQCQLLRDEEQIKTAAGKYRGKTGALDCPSCGGAINYIPGVTAHLTCPACHSNIDAATPKAQILAKGEQIEAEPSTLPLGAKATIEGKKFQIIGFMKRADNEGSVWTEYLLYNTAAGFFWIVETDESWSRAKVEDNWPEWQLNSGSAKIGAQKFTKLYDYPARVTFAAGAFNWRVKVGDSVNVTEFAEGQTKLALEMNDSELTVSRATPLAADQIRAWFGQEIDADKESDDKELMPMAKNWMIVLAVLNALPLLAAFSSTITPFLLSLLALYLPAKLIGHSKKD